MKCSFLYLRQSFDQIYWIVFKEMHEQISSATFYFFILLMPAVQLFVLPLLADYNLHHVSISINDQDNSPLSRLVVSRFRADPVFQVRDLAAQSRVKAEWFAEIELNIPDGFGRQIKQHQLPQVALRAKGIDIQRDGLAIAEASAILHSQFGSVQQQKAEMQSAFSVFYFFNPALDFKVYMAPGILAFLITMIGIYLTVLAVVSEREFGKLSLLSMYPLSPAPFLLGKLIAVWMPCMVVFLVGLLICSRVYGIILSQGLSMLVVFVSIYLIDIQLLALIIARFCRKREEALLLSFATVLVFILTCGLLTPVSSMPLVARILSYLNPVTILISVMRSLALKQSTLWDIMPDCMCLGVHLSFGLFLVGKLYHNFWQQNQG